MTKEEEILKAAEEEFFSNGYDASSTAIIAKRAGVTHAMVNYYFRSKERLFLQILDNHVKELLRSLKPIMQADGDIVKVSIDAACVIFDRMNEDRCFPFILSDISRTHPDFLTNYREALGSICKESIEMHAQRLQRSIASGQVVECTMGDIYSSVVTLALTPFFAIPMLENVAGLNADGIDAFLQARKAEMIRILSTSYSGSSSTDLLSK